MAMPLLQSTFGEYKEVHEWLQKLNYGNEKVTRLPFYIHDTLSGKNISAVQVAKASMTDASPTGFGGVFIFDDPLTEGPEGTSRLVGRAQGLYGSAGQQELVLLEAVNFVFITGKFNASSLTVLGRNAALNTPAQMPIIGGTCVFRLARGFVMAKPYFLNVTSGNSVIEYNVFALHY